MENESRPQKRPFSDTQEFVNKAYVEAYLGERRVDEAEFDRDKPFTYTKIDDEEQFYQADFNNQVMKAGDEIPLIMMPVDEKPNPQTPASKRRPNVTILYLFSDGEDPDDQYVTLQDIGNTYGVSKQMINYDVKRGIKNIHSSSSNKLQNEYEVDSLGLNKPITLVSQMKFSEAHGGRALEIAHLVEDGVSAKQILTKFGSRKVGRVRNVLKRWGLNAPELVMVQRNISEIANKIADPATSQEELRTLIKEFSNSEAYRRYSRGKQKVLVSMSQLTGKAWGNKNRIFIEEAYDLLDQAGIPVNSVTRKVTVNGKERDQTYYFSLERTQEEAIRVLRESGSEFMYSPVQQIAGPELDEIPTTTLLVPNRRTEWSLINIGSHGFDALMKKILDMADFPVPIILQKEQIGRSRSIFVKGSDREAFDQWWKSQE